MRRLAWTFTARIGDKYQIRFTRPISFLFPCLYGRKNKYTNFYHFVFSYFILNQHVNYFYISPKYHDIYELRQNQQCGCVPSEDWDQPAHLPSLIRVFAVRMKKPRALSYLLSAQQKLWSDWRDAQTDWVFAGCTLYFVCFVVRRLILCVYTVNHFILVCPLFSILCLSTSLRISRFVKWYIFFDKFFINKCLAKKFHSQTFENISKNNVLH